MNIKKVGMLVLVVVLFAACSSGPKVTVEEAEKAFIVGFMVIFAASMEAAMGGSMEGVSLSEDGKNLTIEKFPLEEFGQLGYTEVSGTLIETDGVKVVDLTFEGGPVKTLEYEFTDSFDMSNIEMTIQVNGKKIDISVDESDIDALEGQ